MCFALVHVAQSLREHVHAYDLDNYVYIFLVLHSEERWGYLCVACEMFVDIQVMDQRDSLDAMVYNSTLF